MNPQLPQGVLAIWHDLKPLSKSASHDSCEADFQAWHSRQHMSERLSIPGFLRGCRYVAEESSPLVFNFYLTESPAVLTSSPYLDRLNNPTQWTSRIVPTLCNVNRAAGRVMASVGLGQGGAIATLRVSLLPEKRDDCITWFVESGLQQLLEKPGIVAAHLWQTDSAASQVETAESRARRSSTGSADWTLAIEGIDSQCVRSASDWLRHRKELATALREKRLAGAAVDVFGAEPPPPDHPLLRLDNVICTPHLGAATGEAQVKVAVGIAEQIVHFLLTGEARNALNFPFVSAELRVVLEPYLRLGEKLGRLQAQLLGQAPTAVEVTYAGEVADTDVQPVTVAVLRGLLNRLLESNVVNYVNAREVARERGIKVVESKTTQQKGYQNLINLRVETAEGPREVAGAVFGRDIIRLVKIDHFYLEAVPEGFVLLLHNRDVPGVVGAVGTMLAQAGVNIAGLQLGRKAAAGTAISLVHVDEPVSPQVLEQLRTLPNIVSAQSLEL